MISRYFAGEDVPPEILIPSELYYQDNARQDSSLSQPNNPKQ